MNIISIEHERQQRGLWAEEQQCIAEVEAQEAIFERLLNDPRSFGSAEASAEALLALPEPFRWLYLGQAREVIAERRRAAFQVVEGNNA